MSCHKCCRRLRAVSPRSKCSLPINSAAPPIDHAMGRLTFASAPATTSVATFRFDVPVRFDTDHLQVISCAYNLQNVRSIPLVEIRA